MKHSRSDTIIIRVCAAILFGVNLFLYGAVKDIEIATFYGSVTVLSALGTIFLTRKLSHARLIKGTLWLYGAAAAVMVLNIIRIRTAGYTVSSSFTSLAGLFLFAAAYLTGKYKTYKGAHAYAPVFFLLVVPCGLLAFSTNMGQLITYALSIALYVILLKKEGRFESGLTAMAGWCAAAMILMLLVAALIEPDSFYGIASEYAVLNRQALLHSKLFGPSEWYIESVQATAAQYFSWSLRGRFPVSFIVILGWVPFAVILAAAIILTVKVFGLSKTSAGTYAKHLALATGSYFSIRIAISLFVFITPTFRASMFPFTGDLWTVVSDTILLCGTYVLCGRQEADEEGLLDQERSLKSSLDLLSETLHKKIEEMTAKLIPFEDEDYEYDDWPDEKDFKDYDSYREKIRAMQSRVNELDEDRKELEANQMDEREAAVKYSSDMVENIAPGSYKREQVFISYNNLDQDIVEQLAELLEQKGLKVWYYQRDLLAGSFAGEIIRVMKRSRVFIVVVSERSNRSSQVLNEVVNADNMSTDGLIILPLFIENVSLNDDLQYYLSRHEHSFALKRPIGRSLEQFAGKVSKVMAAADRQYASARQQPVYEPQRKETAGKPHSFSDLIQAIMYDDEDIEE